MTRWPCSSTCQASKALAIAATYRRRFGWAFGPTAVPLGRGGRRRPGGRVRAGSPGDDVRGDGGAPRHGDSAGPAGARLPASLRARSRRPAPDLAIDPPPGADDAGAERAPG